MENSEDNYLSHIHTPEGCFDIRISLYCEVLPSLTSYQLQNNRPDLLFWQFTDIKQVKKRRRASTVRVTSGCGGETKKVIIHVILFLCQKKHQKRVACQLSNFSFFFFYLLLSVRAPPGGHQPHVASLSTVSCSWYRWCFLLMSSYVMYKVMVLPLASETFCGVATLKKICCLHECLRLRNGLSSPTTHTAPGLERAATSLHTKKLYLK